MARTNHIRQSYNSCKTIFSAERSHYS